MESDDSLSLLLGEIIADFKIFLGVCFVFRSTNQGNHFVQDGKHPNQSFHNMKPFLSLGLVKTAASQNNLLTVGNITAQDGYNPHQTRREIVNRYHVEVIIDLQISVFEKIVENQLGIGIFLELNGNAKTVPVGFVPHLGNAGHLVIDPHIVNLLDQDRFINLVRNLGDDDLLFTTLQLFNLSSGTHHDATFTSLVGFLNLISALDNGSCREVWTRQKLHEFVHLGRGMVNHIDNRVNDFC